jgi:hypothetical protein
VRQLVWTKTGVAVLGALAALFPALPAAADPPGPAAAYCGWSASTRERALPPALRTVAAKALDTDVSAVQADGYYRCAHGRLLVCTVGANLNCGKADTNKKQRSVIAFCRANPDASVVPMVVTGHDTIYSWSCVHGAPQLQEPSAAVDADGYVADNWREIK